MPEDITKRLAVTFGTGLPQGVHATFKHDGRIWIAYPATKVNRMKALIDRMIGIHNAIHDDMVRWINDWPDDGRRVAQVLERINRGRTLHHEFVDEKIKAVTE